MRTQTYIQSFTFGLIGLFGFCGVQAREVLNGVTKEQVCVSGYSKTIRPSVAAIASWKRKHIGHLAWKDYVVDHVVPLSLSGHPMGSNLQLQTLSESKKKDILENRAHRDLCSGQITLTQAQERF
jgi:hypothetical protein